MTKRIQQFLQAQSSATVCCVDEDSMPYCFSCFYEYNGDEQLLYFKSSLHTKHSQLLQRHPTVAGTILPDKLNKLLIKGLQFEGVVLPLENEKAKQAAQYYRQQKPMALAIPGEVWIIQLNSIKFTDAALGFAKKVLWNRHNKDENIAMNTE